MLCTSKKEKLQVIKTETSAFTVCDNKTLPADSEDCKTLYD